MIAMIAPAGVPPGYATCAPMTPSRSGTLISSVLMSSFVGCATCAPQRGDGPAAHPTHRSLAFDTRRLDDLFPLHPFAAEHLSEFLGRRSDGLDTLTRQTVFHARQRERLHCRGVQTCDDCTRRLRRRETAVPA